MKPSSLQKLEKMDEFKFKPKWHEKKEDFMKSYAEYITRKKVFHN